MVLPLSLAWQNVRTPVVSRFDPPGEARDALRIVHDCARAHNLRFVQKAQLELESLGLDYEHACAIVLETDLHSVRKVEPDYAHSDRLVLVLRVEAMELRLYVKTSVKSEPPDAKVLSFHRWGT